MITKSRHWYRLKRIVPPRMYEPLLSTYYNIRSWRYFGLNVLCPICEYRFEKFIGGHACPYCGSGRRHRLLYLYLENKTNFFKDKLRILHFAPEHCFYKKFEEMENIEYVSADLNSPRAKEKVDMTNIQYADNYFDVVISSHVLEHVPDDARAMKELLRVQNKDGWSIHQAPVHYDLEFTFEDPAIQSNEDRLKFYGHIDHKRLYGRDYKSRLEQAGFRVNEDNYVQSFSMVQVAQYGLDTNERVYFCEKASG